MPGFAARRGRSGKRLICRIIQRSSGGVGPACHAEGRGFESHQPLPRIRLYRALYDVLRVPLGAVARKDFPAGYPLGTQTIAPGVGHEGLLDRAAEHPFQRFNR